MQALLRGDLGQDLMGKSEMLCPYCKARENRVDRVRKYDNVVFRWRECLKCGRMFTTEEVRSDPQPAKKAGRG